MLRFLKVSTLALGLILGSATGAQVHAQDAAIKIAVVDMEQIFSQAKAAQNIKEQMKNLVIAFREETKKEDEKLRNERQQLVQKRTLLSADAFKEEGQKFEQKVLDFQKRQQIKNQKIQKAQALATAKVRDALRDAILKISAAGGYSLVLRNAQTVVVADQMKITNQVIQELDRMLPSVKVVVEK